MFCEFFERKKLGFGLMQLINQCVLGFILILLNVGWLQHIGPGTQWLPHKLVNRSKLGHGNQATR